MAYAGLLATVNLYTAEKSTLTSQLSSIMESICRATAESTQISSDESNAKEKVISEYSSDDTQYTVEMDKINAKYDVQLKTINQWESELEVQKQNLETQVQETSSYLESFESALKQNVQRDSKYAQNQ